MRCGMNEKSPRTMLRNPETVGRYQIVSLIGHGGMGTVYRASDPHLDRIVAIKILRDGMRSELRQRFMREARSVGRLSHPNIVIVHDYGEHEGAPYLVMEFVDGTTLAALLETRPHDHIPLHPAIAMAGGCVCWARTIARSRDHPS